MKGMAGSTARELSLGRGEDRLDQVAATVAALRELGPHASPHAGCRQATAALCRDDAFGVQFFTDKRMVAFRIELGIGQNPLYAYVARGPAYQPRQRGAIIPGRLPRILCQDQLLIHIDDRQPFQPVPARSRLARELLGAANKVAADPALGQPGCVKRDGAATAFPAHAPHHLVEHLPNLIRVQPLQEAIERGVIRYRTELQNPPQFHMFRKTYFRLAKGPIFVPHQTQDRQQLRLGELPLAKLGPIPRQHCLTDLQCGGSKTNQTDFRHDSAERRLSTLRLAGHKPLCPAAHQGCQQSQTGSSTTVL